MATIPQYSPTLPFLGLIPGGLSPGRMLRIKGIITNHGERCQIYIQSGAAVNPRDDVALHISIRPHEHAIVRNSIQNQVVGPEERYGGCPIRYGESFDLLILAEATQYKIAINGAHFCTFGHRLPLHRAQYISIAAGGTIYSILSEADVPGSVPVNPYPPIVHLPPAAPYAPPAIGFVPHAPPSNLPPPPPYTPLPSHPIGGGSGHYPGVGGYPLPPPPPPPPPSTMPGYPHYPTQPPGAPLPAAVPFSPSPSHDASREDNRVKMKNLPFKQTITSGIRQTQDFLRNAVGDKSNAKGMAAHSPISPSHTAHSHPASVQPGFVMPSGSGPGYGAPMYPTAPPPPPGALYPAGYPSTPHPQPQQQQSAGFAMTPGAVASTALAAGTGAAIASKMLPVRCKIKGKPVDY
ncbi:galectin-9B-like isoform X2 [Anopheles merus]|uniref:galectin-9B-like isoform X2 n=1 Tax=Anopheles merus TaxID=30066 RepID=UPI001BE3D013|nr:galectin-9B-like isoform X2 [Anopheles merus]